MSDCARARMSSGVLVARRVRTREKERIRQAKNKEKERIGEENKAEKLPGELAE